jgi:GT2 family glycosyltransferase
MAPPATGNELPRVSVVLSTLGSYETLAKVLDGYERQDASAGSFELLVVSDRAEPDAAAVDAAVGERPYPVRKLTGDVAGASGNRNVGWQAARAPIVLFTDNDTIPAQALVSEHLASHGAHPETEAAVAGRVRWAPGIKVTPFMKWLDRGIQFDFESLSGEAGTWAHLYTANCSIKREFLERVGGYDEQRLPFLYEDLDWGYRARGHGLRVIYNRNAVVDHWRPTTVETWKLRAPMLARSEWQFCQLHPEVEPWFWRLFSEAASVPSGRGRSRQLARFTPRRLPLLGRMVWERAALQWRQEIAPYFLVAWNQAVAGQAGSASPDVAAILASQQTEELGRG